MFGSHTLACTYLEKGNNLRFTDATTKQEHLIESRDSSITIAPLHKGQKHGEGIISQKRKYHELKAGTIYTEEGPLSKAKHGQWVIKSENQITSIETWHDGSLSRLDLSNENPLFNIINLCLRTDNIQSIFLTYYLEIFSSIIIAGLINKQSRNYEREINALRSAAYFNNNNTLQLFKKSALSFNTSLYDDQFITTFHELKDKTY